MEYGQGEEEEKKGERETFPKHVCQGWVGSFNHGRIHGHHVSSLVLADYCRDEA